MNNKPVAWMHKTYFPNGLYEEDLVWSKIDENSIPLYTHLAKTLTDEEIKQIFQEQTGFFFDDNPADDLALMDFARAILRKAQEK